MHIFTRIRKEARILFWPWCMVMLGVVMWLLYKRLRAGTYRSNDDVIQSWNDALGTARLILCAGMALLAAQPFGAEFQARTLPLLLSQPCSRVRLWGEKMLVLAVFAILTPVGIGLLSLAVGNLFAPADVYLWGNWDWFTRSIAGGASKSPDFYMFVPLVCSAGFWSLFARSVIGGFVFSIAALGAVMLTVLFVVGKAGEGHPARVDEWTPLVLSVAGLGYALLFLWFGWRKFAGLELNIAEAGEGGWGNSFESKVPVGSLLRSRVGSPVANLVRKELRLLRPLLGLALLFSLFWLVLTELGVLLPRQKDGAEIVLLMGTCLYMALGLVLAGCLPLCEERGLGLHQTNLILPLAVRIQWRVKLLVALLAGLLAGVVLPVALSIMTAPAIESESPLTRGIKTGEHFWFGIAAFSLLILLGFWSATMIGRLTQAVLLTMFAAAVFVAGWLGIWAAGGRLSISYFPTGTGGYYHNNYGMNQPGYFFTQLTAWIAAHWQLSGEEFGRLDYGNWMAYGPPLTFWPAVILMALATGMQSWRAFRMPPSQWTWPLARLVALVAVLGGLQIVLLATVDHMGSCMQYTPLVIETQAAFNALKPPPLPATGDQIITEVSLAELEATGKLSAQTKFWLRNTTRQFRLDRWNLNEGEHLGPIDPAATDWVTSYAVVVFPSGEKQFIDLHLHNEFVPP
jgi:hypothetical protein